MAKALGRSTPMPYRPSARQTNWFLVNSAAGVDGERGVLRTKMRSLVKSPKIAVPTGTELETTRLTSGPKMLFLTTGRRRVPRRSRTPR